MQTWIDRARSLSILVIGDRIHDQYSYVTPLQGKAAKEYLIPVRLEGSDEYMGGACAVHNQVKAFNPEALLWNSGTITTKQRFVDRIYGVHLRKLFEVHKVVEGYASDVPPIGDLLMVADFGVGDYGSLFTQARDAGKFTAVCAQMNSTNWGYPSLRAYRGANYVVCNEAEARMAGQDRDSQLEHLARVLAATYEFHYLAITEGHKGAIVYDRGKNRMAHAPALGGTPADTMGAGDCFYAWSAPLLAAGAPIEVALSIASRAAGLKCQRVGQAVITVDEVLAEPFSPAVVY